MKPLSLYINIPYCSSHCNFCNKAAHFCLEKDLTPYYAAIIKEIAFAKGQFDDFTVSSIYFGGGMPSNARPVAISAILHAIKNSFILEENVEVTMKTLPGTLNGGYFPLYLQDGINRVSIDFVTQDLFTRDFLNRSISDETLTRTIPVFTLNRLMNYSFDVLYGLPGQTQESFQVTLDFILNFNPAHISLYPLILSEDLPFSKKYKENQMKYQNSAKKRLPVKEECSQLYAFAKEYLESKGFSYYLEGHFSRPGFECKHFILEHENIDTIGFGLGCSSKVDGVRYETTSDLALYLNKSDDFQAITLNIVKA